MRKFLAATLFSLALVTGAAAQEGVVDKTKSAGAEVGDKAEDVKDQTVKGAKKAGEATKKGVNEVGDKAEDVGDKVGDTAGDVKDATVHGAKKAGSATKKGAAEVGDKAEDVKDKTAKGAKKTGNWFSRGWHKVFGD